MQEWLIWHAWKACVLQNGTGGSNPPLSAELREKVGKQKRGILFVAKSNILNI